jgi:protein-tyrosine phosphatase
MGNICRSPAAEAVMRDLVEKAGLAEQIHCDSAGTIGHHVGEPADSRMREKARKRGIRIDHFARKFDPSKDFDNFDYIVTMDHNNFRDIKSLDFDNSYSSKITMMGAFCTEHSEKEIPDPYYGGEEGFDYVLDIVTDAGKNLLNKIKKDLALT